MINYQKIFKLDPYSLNQRKKQELLLPNFKKLNYFHYKNCESYRKIIDKVYGELDNKKKLKDLPFIHVSLFKKFELKTKQVKDLKIFKSSGTSNNLLSKISIDKTTSLLQARALNKIFSNFFNIKKTKILFVDTPNVLVGSSLYSARGAAVNGFKQMFKNYEFLLDNKNSVQIKNIKKNINSDSNEKIVIFGFTSLIWDFLKKIKKKNIKFKKGQAVLIHGGGWKRMENKSVSKKIFNDSIKDILNITDIHNYYGMIEQTGSIFFECEKGYFHPSIFSEIFIRDKNLSNLSQMRKRGLIQSLSILPNSYPGHNILTEDLGELCGIDDCKCGRKGKYFLIFGRAPKTEARGCSDVY